MQRFIFKNKDRITFLTGFLILIAFINHWFIGIENISEGLLIISSIIGVIPIALQAIGSLKVKVISIDLLVTIAVIGALLIKNYEESAVVSFLFLFGAYLEKKTLNKTRQEIKTLTDMAPDRAFKLIENNNFEEVDLDEVDKGDIILVKTGGEIPVDGSVLEGQGHINESSITGESIPVKKSISDKVFAGTILENGSLKIKADNVGEDTTFSKIIDLVEEAQDSKSEAEKFIDSFAKYYTPAVLIIAFIIFIISKDIELAITILVLGCPGALVIGVPVSNVAGIGNGAKNGVLFKGSEIIRNLSKVDSLIFDKTGTLTQGNPIVSDEEIFYHDKEQIIDYIVSVEKESDHPLARAIIEHYNLNKQYRVDKIDVIKGSGIKSQLDGRKILIGNLKLMENNKVKISDSQKSIIYNFEKKGNSIVLTSIDGELAAVIGVRDKVKDDVKDSLKELKRLGVKDLIILSGDNKAAVKLVLDQLDITQAHGEMLPNEKSDFVKELIEKGKITGFVGDGINDSPSLALADIGIAMGLGTDVAIETADLVLMNSDISKLPYAIKLSRAISRNMIENIIIALGVVIILLASLLFSDWMNMSIGMLVHEGSILVVILNAMRLINYKNK